MANKDGLRYPSIDELLLKINSKYKLAYTSALRAKALKENDDSLIKSICAKPVGTALEEIIDDKIEIHFMKKS